MTNKQLVVLKTARMLIQDIDDLESIEKGFFENLARGASSAIRGVPGAVRNAYGKVANTVNEGLNNYAGADAPTREYTKDGKRVGGAVKGSKARKLGGLERAGIATGRRADRGLETLANGARAAGNAIGQGAQALGRGVTNTAKRGVNAVQQGAQAVGRGVNNAVDAAAGAAYDAAGAFDRGVQGAQNMYGSAKNAVARGVNNAAMGAVDAAGKVDAAAGKARRGFGGWLSGVADKISGKKQPTSDGSAVNDGWSPDVLGSKSIISYINSRISFYENQ